LETEKCGWWIDLNVPNLVKALTEALQLQPEVLKAMGARGRKLVEEKYEIGAVAGQMLGFYNQICKLL
jgi:glycosyltransferase involved in cell wall biosynthesis